MKYSETIKKLKELRIDKNISIHDLSEKTNITQVELIQIEDEKKFVGVPTLLKIAHGLDTTLADILTSKG